MKVYFLSDLHLESGETAAAKRFVKFVETLVAGDMLLLGGDIFDLLVGNKQVFRSLHGEAIQAIERAAARGILVHYTEGNHDFHFHGLFSPAVKIHTGDFEVTAHGRKILVSHGDLIDPEDRGYRFLRAITKNWAFKIFVSLMPDFFVNFIGTRSSGASRKYTSGRVENEGTERLRRLYLEFARARVQDGYQHVLVGHSHLKDQIPISVDDKGGEYLNLGFNPNGLVYGVLTEELTGFEVQLIS